MARKSKISYPADTPNSIQDITKQFIQQYFVYRYENGELTAKQVEEWAAIVKEEVEKEPSPVKAFGNYRKKFVEMYYPRLCKKAKVDNPGDFYLNIVKASPIKKA